MMHILAPLDGPFPPEAAEGLARYPKTNAGFLALFRTFANSPRFLRKGVPHLLDAGSPLPLRIREIIILRVTALHDCEYEWGVHAALFAKEALLSREQIAATRSGRSDCWSEKEQKLIAAVDQLQVQGTLDDQALARFQVDWTQEEQLEILALIGAYTTVSMVANVARLAPEDFAERFPPEPVKPPLS